MCKKTSFAALVFAIVSAMGVAAQSAAQPIVVNKDGTLLQLNERKEGPKPKLVLYTTMATWCAACRTELPQFLHLRSVFKPDELGMFGLPYDEKEKADQLKAWAVTHRPPYELLTTVTRDNIAAVKKTVVQTMKIDAVPATIITDANGKILRMRWGPPSVSELRELLRAQRERT